LFLIALAIDVEPFDIMNEIYNELSLK